MAYSSRNHNRFELWSSVSMPAMAAMAALAVGCLSTRPVDMVRRGEAVGVIVTPAAPVRPVADAAAALQSTFETMSGQTLPILVETEYDGRTPAIAIGQTRIAEAMGIAVPQDQDAGDQYVIRSRGGHVALVGNDGGSLRGSVYAAYDLLQRLGCGWYGPTPEWQVIPQTDAIRIPALDIAETAAFDARRIWFISGGDLGSAWRLGGPLPRMGHNLWNLVSRDLIQQHPDWFPHQPPGSGQPDICHPEVIEHIANQFIETLDNNEGFHSFSLCANDVHLWPDSEYTRAVGNAGAQSLYLANEVAARVRERHPGRFALTFYAYWVTHAPPDREMQAAPEVFVFMVDEGNKAKPLDASEPPAVAEFFKGNTREVRHFHGWRATGARMGIRGWWIPAFHDRDWQRLPWIAWETTVRNMRFWHDHGVRHIDIEGVDYERGPRPRGAWPRRWPLYYVGARALWNPDIDPEAVMREACAKLFGPAADPMFDYYRVLERAMFETPYFQQNWNLPPAHKVYTEAIVARADRAMQAAITAVAEADPAIGRRVEAEARDWRETVELLEKYRETPPVFHRVYYDDQYMFWHDETMTMGRIRSLIGLPNHLPVFAVMPDGTVTEPDPRETMDLTSGLRFYSRKP